MVAPETVYRIQAGNPREVIRDTATDNLGKLSERLARYQGRDGITEILVLRHDAKVTEAGALKLGRPIPMLAIHRENEASPWTDIPVGR